MDNSFPGANTDFNLFQFVIASASDETDVLVTATSPFGVQVVSNDGGIPTSLTINADGITLQTSKGEITLNQDGSIDFPPGVSIDNGGNLNLAGNLTLQAAGPNVFMLTNYTPLEQGFPTNQAVPSAWASISIAGLQYWISLYT